MPKQSLVLCLSLLCILISSNSLFEEGGVEVLAS